MVHFPILRGVQVDDFGLFPGSDEHAPGPRIDFHPGLTLVVGANGLGKTTFVTLIYRLLTGPHDIPSLTGQEELGSRRLEARRLGATEISFFAQRVADGAENAVARLTVSFGPRTLSLVRRLSTLDLVGLTLDGRPISTDEEAYQGTVVELAGLGSFGDFVLMLRFIVFYFEDRRALVWDQTAQRQILRMLFLPPESARSWTEKERAILETDSRMRNLRNALTREQRRVTRAERRAESGEALRNELGALRGGACALAHRVRFAAVSRGSRLPKVRRIGCRIGLRMPTARFVNGVSRCRIVDGCGRRPHLARGRPTGSVPC